MKPLSDAALNRLRAAAALPDLTGTRYRLIREAGRGGMGVVYLAEDTELGRQVAMKVLHLDDASPVLAERMRAEARALAHLEHPNIVPVYDFGRLPDGRLFYTMKFVEGKRLDEVRVSPAARLRLFATVCEAVAFAHSKGLLHGDLKPSNIMVGPFGEVLVMDWGLAQTVGAPAALEAGTEGYMAPEPAKDERADVFALGRVLDFLSDTPRPRPLDSIVKKAAAQDPAMRYHSAAAVAEDVLSYLDGLPVSAHRETAWESLARWYRNNRVLLLLIASYVAVRFILFFYTGR